MEVPIWYRVFQHRLSYRDYLNSSGDELGLFVLATLYDHDRYLQGLHILKQMMGENMHVSEKVIRNLYLYNIFSKQSHVDEPALYGVPDTLVFRTTSIKLPENFGEEYIYDWMRSLMNSLFGLWMIPPPIKKEYQITDLPVIGATLKSLVDHKLIVQGMGVHRAYGLTLAHHHCLELKEFLLGDKFPSFLIPVRRELLAKVIPLYWPDVLKTFLPFSLEEEAMIRQAHLTLSHQGDIDFFFAYVDLFEKKMGVDHPLTQDLQQYLIPSQVSDALKAKQFLMSLSLEERRRYLPQIVPVSEGMIISLVREIQDQGFEKIFQRRLKIMRNLIQEQLQGKTIHNEVCFSTQVSIYLYPLEELIFYEETEGQFFVFTRQELMQLKEEGKNPYTRQPFPEELLKGISEHQSENYEEIWSKILRRKIILSEE